MIELNAAGLVQELSAFKEVVVMAAPNYEERSTYSIRRLVGISELGSVGVDFTLLMLQAHAGRVESLEELKQINRATAEELIYNKFKRNAQVLEIGYPDKFSPAAFRSRMELVFQGRQSAVLFVLDVSCIPKRLLVCFIDFFKTYAHRGLLGGVLLLYSWAKGYPNPGYPTHVGSLQTMRGESDFNKSLFNNRRVRAVVLLGRQGFDAKAFVDSLPEGTRPDALIFMNRDNPLHSLEVIRTNAPVLADETIKSHYYFTIASGHQKIMELASHVTADECFYVGAFGPKPVIISACLAVNQVDPGGNDPTRADLVGLHAYHYNGLYSIGHRIMSAYKLELL